MLVVFIGIVLPQNQLEHTFYLVLQTLNYYFDICEIYGLTHFLMSEIALFQKNLLFFYLI